MPPDLSPEAWAQIRNDYEHSDRPVEDICAEHAISSGTLRDRMRRWGWTRRRPPIAPDGPPPAPPLNIVPAPIPAAPTDEAAPQGDIPSYGSAAWSLGVGGEPAADAGAIVPRLQGAVSRLLPAIETTVATLAANPAHPRETERAARVLAALTRTLGELNRLLHRHGAAGGDPASWGGKPRDIEELRRQLACKLEAFVASREDAERSGGSPDLRAADGDTEP